MQANPFIPTTVQQALAIVPWWDQTPNAAVDLSQGALTTWDYVTITPVNGLPYKMIGECTGKHGTKLDRRPKYAKDGQTIISGYRKPTEIDALITIWTPIQLAVYALLLQQLNLASNVYASAVGISYPGLQMLGVNKLYFTEGDVPHAADQRNSNGVAIFRLHFTEWVVPAAAAGADVGPKPVDVSAQPGNSPPTPNATPQTPTAPYSLSLLEGDG